MNVLTLDQAEVRAAQEARARDGALSARSAVLADKAAEREARDGMDKHLVVLRDAVAPEDVAAALENIHRRARAHFELNGVHKWKITCRTSIEDSANYLDPIADV